VRVELVSPAVLPLTHAEPAAASSPQQVAAATLTAGVPPALLLTTDELAALLRVSRRQIERWSASGRIPGRVNLPGRAVRWTRQVILDWLASGCPAPPKLRRR